MCGRSSRSASVIYCTRSQSTQSLPHPQLPVSVSSLSPFLLPPPSFWAASSISGALVIGGRRTAKELGRGQSELLPPPTAHYRTVSTGSFLERSLPGDVPLCQSIDDVSRLSVTSHSTASLSLSLPFSAAGSTISKYKFIIIKLTSSQFDQN